MNMNVQMIEELARRARLSLSDAEKQLLVEDLISLSELLSVLDAWDGEASAADAPMMTLSELREDCASQGLDADLALGQAKKTENGFFAVPATVEVQG